MPKKKYKRTTTAVLMYKWLAEIMVREAVTGNGQPGIEHYVDFATGCEMYVDLVERGYNLLKMPALEDLDGRF